MPQLLQFPPNNISFSPRCIGTKSVIAITESTIDQTTTFIVNTCVLDVFFKGVDTQAVFTQTCTIDGAAGPSAAEITHTYATVWDTTLTTPFLYVPGYYIIRFTRTNSDGTIVPWLVAARLLSAIGEQ